MEYYFDKSEGLPSGKIIQAKGREKKGRKKHANFFHLSAEPGDVSPIFQIELVEIIYHRLVFVF